MKDGAEELRALAEKGKQRKRESEIAEQVGNVTQVADLSNDEKHRRKLAARRISTLADAVSLTAVKGGVLGVAGWMVTMFAAPYFVYFVTGEPVHLRSRVAGKHIFDPSHDGYGAFWPFVVFVVVCVLLAALRLFAWRHADALYQRELDWLRSLPFKVEGYPELLGKKGVTFYVEAHYGEGKADPELMENALRGIDDSFGYERRHADGARETIRMQYGGFFDGRAARDFVGSFHHLIEHLLVPVHDEHPITSVRVNVA